jgi:hypothetical protein
LDADLEEPPADGKGEARMNQTRQSSDAFGLLEFLQRVLAACVLVVATWNPGDHSFATWVNDAWNADTLGAVHAFFGVVLLIGWVILLRATVNSLGMLGLTLGALFLGASVWLMFDLGVLKGHSMTFLSWIALVCIGILLALGLSWSHLWKRITGQVDVDDFDRR